MEFVLLLQGARLEDQRSTLPKESVSSANLAVGDEEQEQSRPPQQRAPTTVPDEDFFSLIMRLQSSGRMDDQRASVPKKK